MGKLLKLVLILALLPGYIHFMTAGFESGVSCGSQDTQSGVSKSSVSESISICTQVTSEVKKKFFDVVWLPVYKWGVHVAPLHYGFFFIWTGLLIHVLKN